MSDWIDLDGVLINTNRVVSVFMEDNLVYVKTRSIAKPDFF